jgi:hypothetical protein
VCEKHFQPGDIVRFEDDCLINGVFVKGEGKKPMLKKDAIPRIFPGCPAYLNKPERKRKSPKKRQCPQAEEKRTADKVRK